MNSERLHRYGGRVLCKSVPAPRVDQASVVRIDHIRCFARTQDAAHMQGLNIEDADFIEESSSANWYLEEKLSPVATGMSR